MLFAILQLVFNESLVGLDNHDIAAGSHFSRFGMFDNVHFKAEETHLRKMSASWPFWRPDRYFDLPAKLNLDPNTPICRVSAFLLLFCIALLIDLVFYLLPIWKRWFLLTRAGALFLLIPLQGMVVWIARASLLLPCTSAVLVILFFAVVKLFLIIKYRIASSPLQESGVDKLFQHITFGFGIIVYAAAFPEVGQSLYVDYGFKQYLVWIIFVVPILVHASGLVFAPSFPKGAFLLSCSQFYFYHLLTPFCPELPAPFFFLLISLLPWMIGAAVNAAGLFRSKPVFSAVLVVATCFSVLCSVEIGIRSISYLNRFFDYGLRAEHFHWDIERHTDLFRNHSDRAIFTPDDLDETCFDAAVKHEVKKTPGVYRIACLGSSSTWGVGSHSGPRTAYPIQLEEYLRKETGKPVEAVNCGIGGAPLFMLEVYLEEIILPYLDPDLVILYFGSNGDNQDVRLYYDHLKEKLADAPFLDSNEEIWAATRLRFVTPFTIRASLTLSKIRLATLIFICLNPLYDESVEPGDAYPASDILLKSPHSIVRLCRKHGKKIVLIPEYVKGDFGCIKKTHPYYEIYNDIVSGSQDGEVYYLRVDEFFSPENDSAYMIDDSSELDVHMNTEGYSFLAEKIGTLLLAEGIIDLHPAGRENQQPDPETGRRGDENTRASTPVADPAPAAPPI